MNNYKSIFKKPVYFSFLIIPIILLVVFIQSCNYLDPQAFKELINKQYNLIQEKKELQKKVEEQTQVIDQMKAQLQDVQNDAQAVETALAVDKQEASDLEELKNTTQDQIKQAEAEIDAKQAEINEANEKINELQEDIDIMQHQIAAIWGIVNDGPCFAGDTLVLMADNSVKAIKDIRPGEPVWSYDAEAGQMVIAEVSGTDSGQAEYYYLINGNLKVTPPHRFLNTDGQWVRTEDLQAGDEIISHNGVTVINSIERVTEGLAIFNIAVQGYHCFYVSADGVNFYLVNER